MDDLTVLYITANKMPAHWMTYQIDCLREAIKNLSIPIISVSRQPMQLGTNFIEEEHYGYWNIYRQLCFGAKQAKTRYVAMAEDDTLYSRQHFTEFRPQENEVSYNRSRWSLFTWDSVYCLRQRISNCSLIAPRELLIAAIEERLTKHPEGDDLPDKHVGEIGRRDVERRLDITRRRKVEWWSTVPVIQLNHPDGIDERQKAKRKKHGQLKARDIPYWGPAEDIARKYHGLS